MFSYVILTVFDQCAPTDLHQLSKNSNQETEAYNNHLAFSQTLLNDQYKCTKFVENNLINWFADDSPGFVPSLDASNNSVASAATSS